MINIKKLNSTHPNFRAQLESLLAWEDKETAVVEKVVNDILTDIKKRGDAALLDYTQRFDGLTAKSVEELEIPKTVLRDTLVQLAAEERHALEEAVARVTDYHKKQLQSSWDYVDSDGSRLGQKVTPLDRVGIYVPGGKAAYPSSVLMNAIPAKVAGVNEIIMVVPTPKGERNKMVLATAALVAVDRVFTIGGAQAIAALAYGTQTIPQVDKITGPGNAYVAAAKQRVFGVVGIDMIAGPSEILVISDGSVPADWIAMDLFSQAEHDEMARSVLLCPDVKFIQAVADSMERLLNDMPRQDVIRASLEKRGALIQVSDLNEACAIANEIAPEHLELAIENPETYLNKIHHAGAIFLGAYSPEVFGDYCAGPNHVLPTARTARFSSPLGVYDFQKRSSVIQISPGAARRLGSIAATLAYSEGLNAHARSAELRIENKETVMREMNDRK